MRRLLFLPLIVTPLLCACTETAPVETDPVDDAKNHVKIVTPEFDVPEGDYFECLYTDYTTDRELSVVSADGAQGPGGHHIIVYYVDAPQTPGHHACTDEEMTSWHQVVGVNGEGTGEPVVTLPDGLAFKVPVGKQIVLQAHYINVSGKTMQTQDSVNLNLVDPSDIKAYANLLGVSDLQFKVGASAQTVHASEATIKDDIQLVVLGGHMHETGSHFKLDILDDQGAVKESLIDEKWSPAYASHPPLITRTMEDPLVLKKGTKLRQTCTWDNTTPMEMVFPREMCVTFGYFFPSDADEIVYLTHEVPAP